MAYRELELTLLSAQGLKNVNLITRMDVYAVVSISGDPLTRQCTEPDTYGGRNPCWDATFRFAVPPTASAADGKSIQVLLRAERFLGDRDVGEVVVPLSDILASANGAGPQPPQVASYQVRKLHRYEPRGVLNVSFRLGPVVAPVVVERAPAKPAAASFNAYAPVGLPRQPSHHYPSAAAYTAPPPAPCPPAVRFGAEHVEAAQNKSPVMAYPMGVPQQQASHLPEKPDAYRPPSPPPPPRPAAVHAAKYEEARAPTPPPPRPAAVHAAKHDEARALTPTPPPPPATPPPTNARSNGLGQTGPTHVYMGPHSRIIFGGAPTTTAGPPTRTTSPARSIVSPAGNKGDGNWAFLPHGTQGNYASSAESMSVSVISPRSRMEDRWRPSVLSQSQHDTQQKQQAVSSPVAAPSPHRLAASSPFSSRSSSFSSPSSPYSTGSADPSPSPSAHSSTRSPYSYSAHPSAATSPHPPLRSPAVSDGTKVTHETYNTSRSTSSRGAAISSPLPSSSPMVPNHSRGAAVSSPLPSSSSLVPKHSSVVPSL